MSFLIMSTMSFFIDLSNFRIYLSMNGMGVVLSGRWLARIGYMLFSFVRERSGGVEKYQESQEEHTDCGTKAASKQ